MRTIFLIHSLSLLILWLLMEHVITRIYSLWLAFTASLSWASREMSEKWWRHPSPVRHTACSHIVMCHSSSDDHFMGVTKFLLCIPKSHGGTGRQTDVSLLFLFIAYLTPYTSLCPVFFSLPKCLIFHLVYYSMP